MTHYVHSWSRATDLVLAGGWVVNKVRDYNICCPLLLFFPGFSKGLVLHLLPRVIRDKVWFKFLTRITSFLGGTCIIPTEASLCYPEFFIRESSK